MGFPFVCSGASDALASTFTLPRHGQARRPPVGPDLGGGWRPSIGGHRSTWRAKGVVASSFWGDTALVVEVRAARPDDATALAEVHVRSWREGYRGLMDQDVLDAMRPEHWMDRFEFGAADTAAPCTLVAVDGGSICGHVTVGPSRDADTTDSAEVWAIYVDPGHWRAGVGRALIDAARERLSVAGHEQVFLWVLSSNARARRFYERAGWETDGRERTILVGGRPAHEVSYRTALPRCS